MKYQGSERNLRDIAEQFKDKLSKIKICAFDIDGILTNGLIRYDGDEMGFNRCSHTSDGYGLKLLMRAGLKVGVISGGDSLGVIKRYKENLNLDFTYFGSEDKRDAFLNLLEKYNVEADEVLFMGDELFDIPLLKKAGFSATVPNSSYEVQDIVDYVTLRESGHACVREVIDILRYARNIVPEIPDFD